MEKSVDTNTPVGRATTTAANEATSDNINGEGPHSQQSQNSPTNSTATAANEATSDNINGEAPHLQQPQISPINLITATAANEATSDNMNAEAPHSQPSQNFPINLTVFQLQLVLNSTTEINNSVVGSVISNHGVEASHQVNIPDEPNFVALCQRLQQAIDPNRDDLRANMPP